MTILKYFALFLTAMLIHSAFGQLINRKPKCLQDTIHIDPINVLDNDIDPNGDKITISKINQTALSNTNTQCIRMLDTAEFCLTSTGRLMVKWSDSFYGTVTLSYYCNDGKSGKGSTGIVIAVRNKPRGEIKRYFGYIIRNNDSCKFSKKMVYWVEVVYDHDTVPGYINQRKAYVYQRDSTGKTLQAVEQKGYYYTLVYTTPLGNSTHWLMDQEDFIYISNNACKE